MIRRRSMLALVPALAAPAIRTVAAEPIQLRVSVESLPTHARTIAATDFCRKVEEKSQGAIRTQLFHSGQLFTDQTVVRALLESQVEMSLPGTWGLTGFVPDVDIMQLPALYSRPIEIAHRVLDGKTGAMIGAAVEKRLPLHVLGRWLDLGFENWYGTSRALAGLDNLKGLKIRNSGGAGKAWRTIFFGGIPNTTPWPSVPLALSQGTFDGLVTTNETVVSASMWESNIHSVLEDHQTFNGYVPVLAGKFWNGLAPEQQHLLTEVWEENVGTYRTTMAQAQDRARATLQAHGVVVTVPDPKDIDAVRARMLTQQDGLIRQWRLSPEIAEQAGRDAQT